jgi:uncharacterized protein YbjQ (UPF0145 family)
MATGMTPSQVVIANEELVRSLERHASEEVLSANIGDDPEDVELKYLFMAQMLALTTTREQRKDMALQLMTTMARQQGGDPDLP